MNVFVKFITIQSRLEKKSPATGWGCNYTHKGICHFQHNMRILIYGITAGELPASIKIAGGNYTVFNDQESIRIDVLFFLLV